MAFTKLNSFSKKPSDMPDIPSPSMTPDDIRSLWETPLDELLGAQSDLADELNGTKWVDEPKLGDDSISRRTIQPGAVGVNEIDPDIMNQPTTAIGVQAKFDSIDSQLSDISYNLRTFNAKIDGVTDDSSIIQSAINTISSLGGGKLVSPKGTMVIDSSIIVPTNIEIDFSRTKIISTMSLANLPVQFFLIDGDDIKINVYVELDITQVDSSTRGRAIEFNTGKTFNNVIIKGCKTRYVYHSVFGFNVTLNDCEIKENDFVSIRKDIQLYKIFGNNLEIEDNKFPIERNWNTPVESMGEIYVCAGFSKDDNEQITDDIYLNKAFKNITVKNNNIYRSNHRPIYIINAIGVVIADNRHEGKFGDVATLGVSDDNFILEFCRDFNVNSNKTGASGENCIDMLACQYGSVFNNTGLMIDNVGLMFDRADTDTNGLANSLSPQYRINNHIDFGGNTFQCRETNLQISIGQNLVGSDNNLSLQGTGSNQHLSFILAATKAFIDANPTLNIKNIRLKNSTVDTAKPNITIDTVDSTHIEWGTVEFGKSLAIESDWLDVTPNTTKAFVHNKGLFNNVEVYFYLDPTNLATYNTSSDKVKDRIRIYGKYTDTSSPAKVHGTWMTWQDVNQVIVQIGDYILDMPQRTVGAGANLGNVTSGKIKIFTY